MVKASGSISDKYIHIKPSNSGTRLQTGGTRHYAESIRCMFSYVYRFQFCQHFLHILSPHLCVLFSCLSLANIEANFVSIYYVFSNIEANLVYVQDLFVVLVIFLLMSFNHGSVK